ncbi:Abhydrolase domain-containing protein [Habropoda laboriosa]|uniref:palmitoyl-protein hydrolase n=1 Tax=Habropoda laboriosa TaxID=597456 RepID=A0A0L7R915_9HYME|nr:Abhydrolase domain-containing protein [Habropoda laboriosa]
MNGLSFSEFCCLFCCPPCPSRIAAKLAFLPPEPTYTFIEGEGSKFTISLSDRAEWQYTEREKESVEVFYARTSRGNRIACLFVRCSDNARFTILFSHGNAVDLGQMSSFYLGLGSRINCNIFSYDYSGYGVSGGKPSEKNLYADIDAAWHALRTRYGISPENIILYGQSIGTVPTVDLAARYEVGAVVLHSPLMSGMRVAFPNTKRTWFFDAFPSIDKIPKVQSPVLVIHGTEDEVINFNHGLAIYERCPIAVEPLWLEGAGHNDIELYTQYLERLMKFVNTEKLVQQLPPTEEKAPVLQTEVATNVQNTKHNKPILESTSVCRNFRLNHISQVAKKHISSPKHFKHPSNKSPKILVHVTLKNLFGQDCRQYAIGEKSLSSFFNTSSDNNKDIPDCNKNCAKNNKKQCCNKISTKETTVKCKSLLREFGRSSLPNEAGKAMINLPKCSPCACRLVASTILSNDPRVPFRFTANHESPHHAVCSRSPPHVYIQAVEKNYGIHLEAEAFVSCATSSTSELTLSYSPIRSEMFLAKVGPRTSSAERSGNDIQKLREKKSHILNSPIR